MSNSFGTIFRLTTFGESHGPAIGGVIDGCPSGLFVDEELLRRDLSRRKPGQSALTTQRKEDDRVDLLSGIFDGKTTGAPIGFMIRNQDQVSADYDALKDKFRPSHADFTYTEKYGFRDHRGGGRSSARETACRIVGGAFAKMLLAGSGIRVDAFVKRIGDIATGNFDTLDLSKTESNDVRCPDPGAARSMTEAIEKAKRNGDSLGGVIQCVITGIPAGLGEPVFDKLHARLGYAVLGINAVKGFEIGAGFSAAAKSGAEMNDAFVNDAGRIATRTNHSGGVQGGISNGMPVYFNAAFKPVATIAKAQDSVDASGEAITLEARGRHDPCVLPRAVPIVEAMAALVLADFLLLARLSRA